MSRATLPQHGIAALAAAKRREFVRYRREGPVPEVLVFDTPDGTNPRLSIIIPTLDGTRGGHLPALLHQLQDQTFKTFEVIVVRGDRRQGRAINTAAAVARGQTIVTMDDDTRLGTPELLQKIQETIEADSSIGIVGVANLVPADGPWLVRRAMRELPRRSSSVVSTVTESDMAEHPCLAIRRDVFYAVGGEHELLPRGLDPYLRREVRALGYRVVVTPNVWIHHMLPSSYRALLKQYFRNGAMAAYVQKFHSEFVIDQATDHASAVPQSSLFVRAIRYTGRIVGSLLTLKWIYLSTLAAYAVGYAWGLLTLREDSA